MQAEAQHDRPLDRGELRRQRGLLRELGQVVEGPVWDQRDPLRGRSRSSSRTRRAPCSLWTTTASMRDRSRRCCAGPGALAAADRGPYTPAGASIAGRRGWSARGAGAGASRTPASSATGSGRRPPLQRAAGSAPCRRCARRA